MGTAKDFPDGVDGKKDPAASDVSTSSGLKLSRDQMNEAAVRLRKGKLDTETTRLVREALDGMLSSGRRFTETDRKKIEDKVGKLPAADESGEKPKLDVPQKFQEAPEGRKRDALLGEKPEKLHAIDGKADPIQEDATRKLIEQGRAKVVPEYRQPVEDYYKKISE